MRSTPSVLLSGFSDEVCRSKDVDLQFGVVAACGLRFVSLRFLRIGEQVKNIIELTDADADLTAERLDHYGLAVSSIGSPLGKVKLLDINDGSENRFCPFEEYLEREVERCCALAKRFGTRLIRGFSFYHPRGTSPADHVSLAAEQVRRIVERCADHDLLYGLEVEANLVGHNANLLIRMVELVDHPSLVLIFDGANLATQNYSTDEIIAQWRQMAPHVGWLHVKDYGSAAAMPDSPRGAFVDEEALRGFVPAGRGMAGYRQVFADIVEQWPRWAARMEALRVPGLFIDLEPHLLAGGQFGGYSSPAGFGVAVREFCAMADSVGLPIQLRGFSPTKM
ncbi:MAG TPA: TIM barrel protein [Pirellulaceae bacterium]|nr:TIM barrel protein [Pirellulaceae bacterium]